MTKLFKRSFIDENEVWAEWYQSYFEICCNNRHKDAEMKSDCNAHIVTRCGYNKVIRQYKKKNKK